jgi:hypothetical protein
MVKKATRLNRREVDALEIQHTSIIQKEKAHTA